MYVVSRPFLGPPTEMAIDEEAEPDTMNFAPDDFSPPPLVGRSERIPRMAGYRFLVTTGKELLLFAHFLWY